MCNLRAKAVYLCLMARRLAVAQSAAASGNDTRDATDDRDYYGNKRLDADGRLLAYIFEDAFKRFNLKALLLSLVIGNGHHLLLLLRFTFTLVRVGTTRSREEAAEDGACDEVRSGGDAEGEQLDDHPCTGQRHLHGYVACQRRVQNERASAKSAENLVPRSFARLKPIPLRTSSFRVYASYTKDINREKIYGPPPQILFYPAQPG